MQFQQSQFNRSTYLALREHGLYVCQRDGQDQVQLEVEMPYEEILPVRLERRNQVPRKRLYIWLGVVVWSLLTFALDHHPDPDFTADFARWTIGLGGSLLTYTAWGLRYRWCWLVLHTARLHVVLTDLRRDRQGLEAFVEALRARTKGYLREEYGAVNPLGFIEPQLRRVAWLRELEVLSAPEAQALSTRLTGRISAETLRSMGQELEAPYVN